MHIFNLFNLISLSVINVVVNNSRYTILFNHHTQSRIIGTVRGGHSQLWGTIIPICSLYAARKYNRRFGTPAIV